MTNHRKAFLFALGMFLLPWFLIYVCHVYSNALMYAFGYTYQAAAGLMNYFHIGEPWGWALGLLLNSLVAFFLWYFVARLWLGSTRHFKLAFVGVALFALLTAWGLHHYENRIDWTSRGLNPDRPGFKSQVVILTGTFDYWINDTSINQIKSGSANFEIRMNGFDNYYCKKWRGNEWKVGSWFRVELALKDFSESWGLSYLSHTVRGGGGSWLGEKDIILARRLWNKAEFVGAKPDELEVETQQWGRKEEFKGLMKVGPYFIPKKIKLTERKEQIETYTIRKVEFSSIPSTNWFWKIKQKYFDRDPELRSANLDEPGVIPGGR